MPPPLETCPLLSAVPPVVLLYDFAFCATSRNPLIGRPSAPLCLPLGGALGRNKNGFTSLLGPVAFRPLRLPSCTMWHLCYTEHG